MDSSPSKLDENPQSCCSSSRSIIKPDQTPLSKVKNIAQFSMGEKLGEGTFGVVRIATHILTGERVAVKVLDRARIREQADKTRIEREIEILKKLHHSNIIHLYSVINTNYTLYLVQEYASGKELFEYIISKKKLSDNEACKYFQQIISGVEYIHKLQIAHRDLKPENMLLTSSKDIKIVDFGLSNTYKKGGLLSTACGSPCYAAPEMLSGKQYRGITVDIWSCGVILFVMLCGYLPFEDNNNESLYKKIIGGKYTIPNFVSKSGKDLLKKILETNPRKRITVPEIKKHPWFNLIDSSKNVHNGIDTKVNVIPIDEEIVSKMESYEYNKEEVRANVLMNEHNHITTTYYLLLKKKTRKKVPSVSDLKSEEFEKFFENPENLMSNYSNDITQVIKMRASSKGVLEQMPNLTRCSSPDKREKESSQNESKLEKGNESPIRMHSSNSSKNSLSMQPKEMNSKEYGSSSPKKSEKSSLFKSPGKSPLKEKKNNTIKKIINKEQKLETTKTEPNTIKTYINKRLSTHQGEKMSNVIQIIKENLTSLPNIKETKKEDLIKSKYNSSGKKKLISGKTQSNKIISDNKNNPRVLSGKVNNRMTTEPKNHQLKNKKKPNKKLNLSMEEPKKRHDLLKTEKQPNDTKENIVDKKENINETKENIVNHTDNDIDKNDNNIEVKKENIENTETNLIKDKGIKQSTTEENNILESKDNEIKNDTKVVEKTVTKEANNFHKKVINDKMKYPLSDHKKSYKKQIISRQPQIDQKNEIKTNTTVTITNSTINKIDNKTSIISPFDLSCLFFKQPKAMKEELGKIINSQKLKIKNDKVKLNFL